LFAISLRCVNCGTKYPISEKIAVCTKCQGLLEIEYDYARMREEFKKADLKRSATKSLWRYSKTLPVREGSVVSLGEGFTPLVHTRKIDNAANLMAKLDYIAPTSSFKDRGSTVAVSKANELKASSVAIDSTGNAAASVSAYAAKAGIRCYVFIPSYTEPEKVVQVSATDATVIKVEGTRQDAHDVVEAAYRRFGWYYCGFMVSPYAIEGTKTIAYEICEQLNWIPPDWIIFPVGTGSGIIGCYKGLKELLELGWIDRIPKLVCIQAEGCSPIAGAYKSDSADIIPVKAPKTVAEGLAVGAPPKGRLVLDALHKTGGLAEVVNDSETLETARNLASKEGLFVEVSAAASVAGAMKLIRMGVIDKADSVVCELTGTGLKSHQEYAKMVRKPLEIQPNLESLLQVLKNLKLVTAA
jgi:threonine synthase